MMDIKGLIFELMMADVDEHGHLHITKEVRGMLIDTLIGLYKKASQKDKPSQTAINLNSYIKVRLTNHGKDIYRDYQTRLAIALGHTNIRVDVNPKIDADGYTRFQFWNFIEIFGNYISIGEEPVIAPLDIIKDK